MLGITDRSKILNLLNFIFQGEQKKSIDLLREMINEGIEPVNFLNDLLEIIYFIQQKKSLGNFDSELSISESEQNIINSISNNISMPTLIVFWQFILKVIDELSVVSNPILSLEMLVVRLVHLKEMPSYEDVLNSLKTSNFNQIEESNNTTKAPNNNKTKIINDENQITNISKNQIKNTIQTKPVLSPLKQKNSETKVKMEKVLSFENIIQLAAKKKEIQLKYDLERINLIKFSIGKINISFNENLDKNFVRNLSKKLYEWTGNRWLIILEKKEGQKNFIEVQDIKRKEFFDQEKKGAIYKKFKNIFSDGELLEVDKED